MPQRRWSFDAGVESQLVDDGKLPSVFLAQVLVLKRRLDLSSFEPE
jgi:hypothetical protein